jgi:hypothetical protein
VTVLQYDSAIGKHLRPGERLRWVARPKQKWSFRWNNRLILLQAAAAIVTVVWLARMVVWAFAVAGFDLHLALRHPTLYSSSIVLAFVGVTSWQVITDRRRRAGTWYAVTDRRVLFVLTSVRPESVVAVEFDELAQISSNAGLEVFGSLKAVVLKLKRVDPYMAGSDVLGYQMADNAIILEDLEDPQEFRDQIVAARLARHAEGEPVSTTSASGQCHYPPRHPSAACSGPQTGT